MADSVLSDYAQFFLDTVCNGGDSAERVLRQLYPEGAKCASCAAWIRGHRAVETFWAGERTYCASCDKKFTPATGTVFEGSHLTYRQFEIILVCLSLGVEPGKIATLAKIHEDTVLNWTDKLRSWESHV